jgi:hypothetical protein
LDRSSGHSASWRIYRCGNCRRRQGAENSAEALYEQAGITEQQRQSLLTVYRTCLEANGHE